MSTDPVSDVSRATEPRQGESQVGPSTPAASQDAPQPSTLPASPRRWLHWAILGMVAAGVAVLFVWSPGGDDDASERRRRGMRPTPVSSVPVERGPLVERATYPGELDADAAEIASLVPGRLIAVLVRIGDRVEKGQELARVDSVELVRQRAEAAAAVRAASAAELRARVQLEAAAREAERGQGLADSGTISRQEIDRLQAEVSSLDAAVKTAAAQQAQATARVAMLDQKIRDAVIRAPFAGTVAARHHNAGSFVAAGTSVIRLVADEPLRVRFDVPEQDVARFGAETVFVVRAPPTGAKEVPGRVTGLGTEVDRARRIVRVEGVLEERPDSWLPGMFAEVVATQRTIEDALIVPAAALVARLQEGGAVHTGVFRPEGEVARWVPVQVIARDGERVAVEAALEPGALVLVGGHTDLADDAPIAHGGDGAPRGDGAMRGQEPRRGDGATRGQEPRRGDGAPRGGRGGGPR